MLLLLFYQLLGAICFILALPYVLWRFLRHPQEMTERMGRAGIARSSSGPAQSPPGPARSSPGLESSTTLPRGALWVHAASLGELEALRSLAADPRSELLAPFFISVLSVSGRPQAQAKVPRAAGVTFAPLDLFFAVEPFLNRTRPRGLIILETELWPWTLASCRRRGIPVAVISARLSPRKWSRTRLLRPLLRPLVTDISGVAAQSEADGERFRRLGSERISITGNLKYRSDHTVIARDRECLHEGKLLVVAGSLRRGEEEILEAARHPEVSLIIAPRHLRERNAWRDESSARGIRIVLRSELTLSVPGRESLHQPDARRRFRAEVFAILGALTTPEIPTNSELPKIQEIQEIPTTLPAGPRAILLDTHGELSSWYAAADLAFVGGTLVPIGGHNLFEPAREGIPVAFGPHTDGVADLAEPLVLAGGGFRVTSGPEFLRLVERMAGDGSARAAAGRAALRAAGHVAGASDRTWSFLESLGWALHAPSGPRR